MRRGRPRHDDVLTPREWEVLYLLRDGLTNEQIAGRLSISESGARYHVSEILSKLGVASRQEAAAWQQAPRPRPAGGVLAFIGLAFKKVAPGSASNVAAGVALAGVGLVVAALAFGIIVMQERETEGFYDLDAGRLAYVQDGDLWLRDLPDGEPRLLIEDAGNSPPRWSPSGDWLLLRNEVIHRDGSRLDAPGCTEWSPVADELVCSGDGVLAIESADGSVREILAGHEGNRPRWSPDGRYIAYAVDGPLDMSREPWMRESALWVVDRHGVGPRMLFSNQAYTEYGGQVMTGPWSPDGKTVTFFLNPSYSNSAPNDGLPYLAVGRDGGDPWPIADWLLPRDDFMDTPGQGSMLFVTAGNWRETWTNKRIATLDTADGSLTYLTDAETAAFSPALSPDGSLIAYVAAPDIGSVGGGEPAQRGASQRRIWLMFADGSAQRPLTNDPAYRDERPVWSADGRHILFVRLDSEDRASLWLLQIEDAYLEKIADISRPGDGLPLWFGFYGYTDWDNYFDLHLASD